MKKNVKPVTVTEEDAYQKAKNWSKEEWDLFHKFGAKVQKMADETFGTYDDGSPIVHVSLRNAAFHQPSGHFPVIHESLLTTDEEWRREIDTATMNVSTSSEHLSRLIRCWNFDQDYKQGIELLRVAADKYCREVLNVEGGCVISSGYGDNWPVLGEGRAWYAEKWSTEDNDYKGRTFSFNPNTAKFEKGLDGVPEFISRRVNGIMSSMDVGDLLPYSIMLALNDDSLRVYCEVNKSWVPGGKKSTTND